jgi:serine/threonine protein kinase
MMALRHPNVVLFMAASTSAEKMCLVMEYMALGSLFDVLQNELIPGTHSSRTHTRVRARITAHTTRH